MSCIFLVVVLSCSFVARKNQSARHKQKQSFCVLLTSRKRHSSVTQNLPQTTFRSNIGGKRTRFSRINSNTQCTAQTAFALSPLFERLFVVFLIVPVFFWNYLCCSLYNKDYTNLYSFVQELFGCFVCIYHKPLRGRMLFQGGVFCGLKRYINIIFFGARWCLVDILFQSKNFFYLPMTSFNVFPSQVFQQIKPFVEYPQIIFDASLGELKL